MIPPEVSSPRNNVAVFRRGQNRARLNAPIRLSVKALTVVVIVHPVQRERGNCKNTKDLLARFLASSATFEPPFAKVGFAARCPASFRFGVDPVGEARNETIGEPLQGMH
jgi:hypothetical protein